MPLQQELATLATQIKQLALDAGFSGCGLSQVQLMNTEVELVQNWLAAGYNGSMGWMANNLDKRTNPQLLVEGTLSILSVRLDYQPPAQQAVKVLNQPEQAYISRYALGRDYHKIIRKRLAQLAKQIEELMQLNPAVHKSYPQLLSRAFTDSAPVLEKAWARTAGLGWQAKNCLLLTRKAGSWFFLGEIFLNLPLPADAPFTQDHCGTCTACLDACPTQAFVGAGQLDARKCISYLTIENAGAIPVELRPKMGNRIYGCDDCQLVCPWNKFAPLTQETDFHPRHNLDAANLLDLFAWDETTFLRKLEGSPIRRIGYFQWQRNLAVALGNAPFKLEIIHALQERLSQTKDILLAEHLNWAITQQKSRQ